MVAKVNMLQVSNKSRIKIHLYLYNRAISNLNRVIWFHSANDQNITKWLRTLSVMIHTRSIEIIYTLIAEAGSRIHCNIYSKKKISSKATLKNSFGNFRYLEHNVETVNLSAMKYPCTI